MSLDKGTFGDAIFKDPGHEDDEAALRQPTVLSCGGIFIPRRARERIVIHQIINTPGDKEPVKVVTGARPRNILFDVLQRESMN